MISSQFCSLMDWYVFYTMKNPEQVLTLVNIPTFIIHNISLTVLFILNV